MSPVTGPHSSRTKLALTDTDAERQLSCAASYCCDLSFWSIDADTSLSLTLPRDQALGARSAQQSGPPA